MNKTKDKLASIVSYAVMFVLIAVFSLTIAKKIAGILTDTDFSGFLVMYFVFLGLLLISTVLQTAIHEAGHMIMGLLTGYRFVSYRLFNLMISRNSEGKLELKKHSMTGTAGQCLMGPPEYSERFPCILYNAGGVLVNLLTALLAYFLMDAVAGRLPKILLGTFALAGIFTGFGNGVPMKTAMAPNDGMNILELLLHPSSRRAFWQQMKANELLMNGVRAKDMPEELLKYDESVLTNGSLGAFLLCLRESTLMDRHDFDGAYQIIEEAFDKEYPLPGISRCAMMMDKVTVDCLRGSCEEINDKLVRKYIKASRSVPTVLRAEYAAALYRKDEQAQQKLLQDLEKLKDTYPYPADLQGEMELVDILKERMKS
ncbi:MAG: hypothetical protein IKX74_00530 [Erysipelotrichaceae bacterium]|nr:hypothetical protein [Erysipelotrichaceae bacterium]MBR5048132.1 hypothetical protein [Erysipelotrichaceae bacterium]